ncbi:ABC transporter ATP-binding protein [Calderihabitans maritimus]|uniref:ABC transporter domain-containing protein n=1 Tax=Calderihabitans maritimus TaxID=1246530 RepID=A0A1Z5HU11_9FIRM|nr:ABC transporter ATP-binding protein [Calderihabitans maritimus]GAW93029.1 hypothetical protein KKC1_21720 [Calderihabitans maritimus]
MALLTIKSLTHYFGGLRAVANFDIEIDSGGIYGLIGPNGAGKTTVFNLITGIYRPMEGSIIFKGEDLVGKPPHYIAKKGIARTFQNLRLFSRLTVRENIEVVRFKRVKKTGDKEINIKTDYLLELLNLEKFANYNAGDLPYGAQRRLEIARALSIEPDLLLLDEPAAGMNPSEVDNLGQLIKIILEQFDITILLIEHHMRLVMQLCHQITVMNFGEVIARGTPEEIRSNKNVVEAYLGKGVIRLRGKRAGS